MIMAEFRSDMYLNNDELEELRKEVRIQRKI